MANKQLATQVADIAFADDDFLMPFFSDKHAFFIVMNSLIGYGSLTLQYAFYHSSGAFACVIILMIGVLFQMFLLLQDVQIVRQAANVEERLTLGTFMGYAIQLGPKPSPMLVTIVRIVVDAITVIGCLLMASCCLSMAARNLPILAGKYAFKLDDDPDANNLYYLAIGSLCLLPCSWIRTLKHVSVFASLSVSLLMGGVLFSLWYKWDISLLYTDDELKARTFYSSPFIFIGMLVYVLMPVTAMLPLEHELGPKKPHLRELLGWSMVFATLFHAMSGYLAYAFTGPATVADYFANSDPFHVASWCSLLCCGLGVLFAFVLQFYLMFELLRAWSMNLVLEFACRTLLMLLCFGLAVLLRFVSVERIVCGLGTFCCIPLGLLVPAISHFLLHYDESPNLIVAFMGFVIFLQFLLFGGALVGFIFF